MGTLQGWDPSYLSQGNGRTSQPGSILLQADTRASKLQFLPTNLTFKPMKSSTTAAHTEHTTWESVLQMNSKRGWNSKLPPHLPRLQAVKPYYTPFADTEFTFSPCHIRTTETNSFTRPWDFISKSLCYLQPICKLWWGISKALLDHFCLCLSALSVLSLQNPTLVRIPYLKAQGLIFSWFFLPGYTLRASFSIFLGNSKSQPLLFPSLSNSLFVLLEKN